MLKIKYSAGVGLNGENIIMNYYISMFFCALLLIWCSERLLKKNRRKSGMDDKHG